MYSSINVSPWHRFIRACLLVIVSSYHISGFASDSENDTRHRLSAQDIMYKAEYAMYYAGNTGRTSARMVIVDVNGNKQRRQFTLLRRNRDQQNTSEQDLMVYFSRPTDIKGTAFRVEKLASGEDNRWLYLPGLNLTKRISAGDKRTSFVGSHFYYEDVSGRRVKDDTFELLEVTSQHYVIKATPKNPAQVEFAYYVAYVRKRDFLPQKVTYFDPQNQQYRESEALDIQVIDDIPTVMVSKLTDHLLQGYSILSFRHADYGIELPAMLFTERAMRKPPKQYLRRAKPQ